MTSARLPQAALVPASADDVEQQFYEALQRGDIEHLMGCWLDDDDVSCVHPGGPRVVGFRAIRASFDEIFGHGAIDIHLHEVRRMQNDRVAVHSVIERVDVPTDDGARSAWVLATNVFVATERGWRIVSHHASPGTPGAASPGGSPGSGPAGSVLH